MIQASLGMRGCWTASDRLSSAEFGLIGVCPQKPHRTLAGTVRDAREWRELLSDGVEEVVAKRLERSLSTGRPVGSREFVQGLERRLGRDLAPRTGGWPKGKKRKRWRN